MCKSHSISPDLFPYFSKRYRMHSHRLTNHTLSHLVPYQQVATRRIHRITTLHPPPHLTKFLSICLIRVRPIRNIRLPSYSQRSSSCISIHGCRKSVKPRLNPVSIRTCSHSRLVLKLNLLLLNMIQLFALSKNPSRAYGVSLLIGPR